MAGGLALTIITCAISTQTSGKYFVCDMLFSFGLVQRSAATLVPFLYSSHEPGELSQWLCYDDSTINIVTVITSFSILNYSYILVLLIILH